MADSFNGMPAIARGSASQKSRQNRLWRATLDRTLHWDYVRQEATSRNDGRVRVSTDHSRVSIVNVVGSRNSAGRPLWKLLGWFRLLRLVCSAAGACSLPAVPVPL